MPEREHKLTAEEQKQFEANRPQYLRDSIAQLAALVEMESPTFLIDNQMRILCRLTGFDPAAPDMLMLEPGDN